MTITAGSLKKIDEHDNFTRAQFPAITVTVVRDRKIGTALRTNQTAGLVTVPSSEKYQNLLHLSVSTRAVIDRFSGIKAVFCCQNVSFTANESLKLSFTSKFVY